MGQIKEPKPVKLIASIISNEISLFEKVENVLQSIFGSIDFHSEILLFNHTDYYNQEMRNNNLIRKFICFEKLILPDEIANIKVRTNEIEKMFLTNENRNVNIDVGYITLGKLVLASTKDYSHRIYLKNGIYAETTLHFFNNNFSVFPYTYPDYATEEVRNIFKKMRDIFKIQIKKNNNIQQNAVAK